MQPWPLDEDGEEGATSAFTLDRLLDHVDAGRMDILDTLIRVTLQEVDADLMRHWRFDREHRPHPTGRGRRPGRLFSPLDIPDDF